MKIAKVKKIVSAQYYEMLKDADCLELEVTPEGGNPENGEIFYFYKDKRITDN